MLFSLAAKKIKSSSTNIQEAQVLKALVLGEEERGQSQYQVMCFVTKFQKGDFITSDAMAKLRQVREKKKKRSNRFLSFLYVNNYVVYGEIGLC